ncbi:MAG TPA: type I 3-dehydroquinate dehydratase [Thermoplasmata archaeon]|nr:type I 3-dehydroquinate dehydratase [Thermoplasmata archaeon]
MIGPARTLIIATAEGREPDAVRSEIERAASLGADVVEVRFDRWGRSDWARMGGLFPSPIPLLATLRSRTEGGEGPDDSSERAAWRHLVREQPFAYIDREWNRDPSLADEAKPRPDLVEVNSIHESAGADSVLALAHLAELSGMKGIAKVVFAASVDEVLGRLVPHLPAAPSGGYVVHTTGPSGSLLRAWSRRLGMAAVFSTGSGVGVEPSQLPLDRIVPFLQAPPDAPIFAVVGRPILHSLSPALHHRWMRALGHVGLYITLEIGDEGEFHRSARILFERGFRGLNVTHPLKASALGVADSIGESARECGCANMLTFTGGRIEAENTDLLAISLRFEELERSGDWDGTEVLVVGSGGAACAALAAARERGTRAIVLARSPARAGAVAAEFGAGLADDSAPRVAGLVVHCTPAGHPEAGDLAVPLRPWVGHETYVLDFVYGTAATGVADLARAAGGRYEDGIRLLAYGAAASYGRWWNCTIPHSLVRDAAEGEA